MNNPNVHPNCQFKQPLTSFTKGQWILFHVLGVFLFPLIGLTAVMHVLQINCERHNDNVERLNREFDEAQKAKNEAGDT